jgi:hypothetical protein
MDWQLGIFRFGLLVCFLGPMFAATQFEIAQSIVAIWNHNPTAQEISADEAAKAKRLSACLSAEDKMKVIEFPSTCYPSSPGFRGLNRDSALENVRGFVVTSLALFITMFSVVFLGLRMARESRV